MLRLKSSLFLKSGPFFEEQGMKIKVIELIRTYFQHQPLNFYCVPIQSFIEKQVSFGFKSLIPQEVEAMQLKSFYNYVFLVYDFFLEMTSGINCWLRIKSLELLRWNGFSFIVKYLQFLWKKSIRGQASSKAASVSPNIFAIL